MVDDMLIRTVTEIFGDLVRSSNANPSDGVWAASSWELLADNGIAWVGVPEANGGEGGDGEDAAALLRLAGRFALPLPLAENALLAGWLLDGTDLQTVRSGATTVVPGHFGDTLAARASDPAEGPGWIVDGTAHRVPWAGDAAQLIALLPVDDGNLLVVLPRSSYRVMPGQNLAGERRDRVIVEAARTELVSFVDIAPAMLARRGAISRAILIAGALERVLELTVNYANQRVQFGRPISRFQAVGQQLARLAEETALAGVAADLAIACLGTGMADAAVAKSGCGRSASEGARLAHQVHGAIGVTEEYELHRLTRRLLAWRDEYGAERVWESQLGQLLSAGGPLSPWDLVIGTRPASSVLQGVQA